MKFGLLKCCLNIALLASLTLSCGFADTELTIMTYNIRLDIASDGENQWSNRKEALVAQIQFQEPDLFGIQEGLPQQVDYLDQALSEYSYVGIGRDDGERAGEFSAIFFRQDKIELIESNTFWLSETPDKPSFGWGASYRRICTYGHFRDRETKQTYWVFNTHFDHQVAEARRNGAKLILDRIEQLVTANEPCFLIGDLNATPDSPEIKLIAEHLNDSRTTASNHIFGQEGTFNGFDPQQIPDRRIDYIFISQRNVSVDTYATLSDLIDMRFPSDHFPVIARVRIKDSDSTTEGLKISQNQRYLESASGQPFLWLGDTAWELFHRLNREEADHYLSTRAAQGFNLIQAVALAELEGLTSPNAYGHLPLIDNDPTQPNEAYFEHVDYIVNRANELGIFIGMLPTWGDKFNKKWGVGPEIFSPSNAEVFGQFMGERYRDASIVWILGGDRIPEENEDFEIIEAMAQGIHEGDNGKHLISYHPQGRQKSSNFFNDSNWIDFNMHQSGHSDESYHNFTDTLAIYNLTPTRPVLDAEPCYEDHTINWKPDELGWFDDFDSRRAGYWSMLSGALGHTYGHHSVWQMWQPGRHPITHARTPWQEALHYPGAIQAGYMRSAFESFAWWSLEPDHDRVANAPTDPAKTILASSAPDKSLMIAYTPFGSSFDLNTKDIGKKLESSKWFNPRNNSYIPFTVQTDNGGEFLHFDPPADEKRGNDWLLILKFN